MVAVGRTEEAAVSRIRLDCRSRDQSLYATGLAVLWRSREAVLEAEVS